jgi:hypothetical protein
VFESRGAYLKTSTFDASFTSTTQRIVSAKMRLDNIWTRNAQESAEPHSGI